MTNFKTHTLCDIKKDIAYTHEHTISSSNHMFMRMVNISLNFFYVNSIVIHQSGHFDNKDIIQVT